MKKENLPKNPLPKDMMYFTAVLPKEVVKKLKICALSEDKRTKVYLAEIIRKHFAKLTHERAISA